jgi:hypothetical protein
VSGRVLAVLWLLWALLWLPGLVFGGGFISGIPLALGIALALKPTSWWLLWASVVLAGLLAVYGVALMTSGCAEQSLSSLLLACLTWVTLAASVTVLIQARRRGDI